MERPKIPPQYRCPVCDGPKSSLDMNCWKCAKWAREVYARLLRTKILTFHNL